MPPGQAQWTHVVTESIGDDRALDVELTADGDAFVGGFVVTAPPPDEDTPADTAAWVARLSLGDGDLEHEVLLRPDETSRALASGLAIDPRGNIAIAGARFDADEEGWDIWVASVDREGALRWEATVAGPAGGEDQGVGIAASDDGLVYVAGYVMTEEGSVDAWLGSFDADDGTPGFASIVDESGGGFDVATDIAVDADGRPIAVGYRATEDRGTDAWVAAVADDGTLVWSTTIDGDAHGDDRGAGVAVLPSGRLVVVGTMVVPGTTVDAFMAGLSREGEVQWLRTHDGPASLGDGATDVAPHPDGGAVIGGYEFVRGDKWDVWVQRIEDGGAPVWTHRHAESGGGDDVVAGVATTEDGDAVVAGSVALSGAARGIWIRRVAG